MVVEHAFVCLGSGDRVGYSDRNQCAGRKINGNGNKRFLINELNHIGFSDIIGLIFGYMLVEVMQYAICDGGGERM